VKNEVRTMWKSGGYRGCCRCLLLGHSEGVLGDQKMGSEKGIKCMVWRDKSYKLLEIQ